MVEVTSQILIYIYATVGLIIVLLIWNGYLAWRTKRIIQKQINNEQKPAYQMQQPMQYPTQQQNYPQQQYGNQSYPY